MIDWRKTFEFVRKDWRAHPVRLCLETTNWLLNLIIATTVSLTVPYVDWLLLYPIIFVAISISIFSAVSRGSFGLLMTSLTLLIIDSIGYYRILML